MIVYYVYCVYAAQRAARARFSLFESLNYLEHLEHFTQDGNGVLAGWYGRAVGGNILYTTAGK